jgi:hypothetical protein
MLTKSSFADCSNPVRMDKLKKRFVLGFRMRSGFGTLEVVIIIAVLLTIALIFRHSLLSFATNLIDTVFNKNNVIAEITVDK